MSKCAKLELVSVRDGGGGGLGKMTDGQANQDKNINFNFKKSQSEPLVKVIWKP